MTVHLSIFYCWGIVFIARCLYNLCYCWSCIHYSNTAAHIQV